MAKRPFAVVPLSLLEPLLDALEAGGMDGQGLLEEMGLPAPGQVERFVPQQAVYRFVAETARRLGDPYLGARLGANRDYAAWPPWRHAIARAQTVGDLLTWFIVGVERHGTSVRYTLEIGDRATTFQQLRLLEPACSVGQIDAMGAAFFSRILKQAPPDAFYADRLVLRVSEPDALPADLVGNAAVVRCDRRGFSVQFPSDWLTQPLPAALTGSVGQVTEQAEAPAAQPADALRQVVKAYLDDGALLEIQDLARLFDTSEKAIQRELRKAGTHFPALVDDIRHQQALCLVGDPAQSITSIAYGLGYSDPANFSRAFRRWTDHSPREFRRRLG